MNCQSLEQDILLFAHNALGPVSRLRVSWHLRRCPACRARLGQAQNVSQTIANVLRPPGLAAWKPPRSVGLIGLSPVNPVPLLLLTALVVVLVATAVVVVDGHRHAREAAAGSRIGHAGPCRPDLPNSKCR